MVSTNAMATMVVMVNDFGNNVRACLESLTTQPYAHKQLVLHTNRKLSGQLPKFLKNVKKESEKPSVYRGMYNNINTLYFEFDHNRIFDQRAYIASQLNEFTTLFLVMDRPYILKSGALEKFVQKVVSHYPYVGMAYADFMFNKHVQRFEYFDFTKLMNTPQVYYGPHILLKDYVKPEYWAAGETAMFKEIAKGCSLAHIQETLAEYVEA